MIDTKIDITTATIARIVRSFRFYIAGACLARALIGQAVLDRLGIASELVAGSLLYRVGKHRRRDTWRLALPDINLGGMFDGYIRGHVWIEVGEDIVDFSSGDWIVDANNMYEADTTGEEQKLGRIDWLVQPPNYIWTSKQKLTSGWKRIGFPKLGEIWYGDWIGREKIDLSVYDPLVDRTMEYVGMMLEGRLNPECEIVIPLA